MDAFLRSKLEHIHERYEELGDMLCAPEIVSDKPRLLALSREHAELRPVAEAFGEYRGTHAALAETEEMLTDPEQKIARPRQIYVGPPRRDYVSRDKRK